VIFAVQLTNRGGIVTAEIAILNKTAVALAADSAVTISAGTDQQKVYDSEDKLFELSRRDAIGIMINSNMHFMQAPLPVIIKRFRATCGRFDKVEAAAEAFLEHLKDFGINSSTDAKLASIIGALEPIWLIVQKRHSDKFTDQLDLSNPADVTDFRTFFGELRDRILADQIAAMCRAFESLPPTEMIGDGISDETMVANAIATLNDRYFPGHVEQRYAEFKALAELVLTRRVLWSPHTGIIVAGFGSLDLFPTLISYEIFGMVGDKLRAYQTNHVDIDRDGTRAKVIPFAQKEMVERFLYGLDDDIQRKITDFCRRSIPSIREQTLGTLVMDDEDRSVTESEMLAAEDAFLDGLREHTFEAIRAQSEAEIEDMVEFMPKSEMAKMAEALVNLTSIKRRVSRGLETVGGPIDCAVISQADGFIWVNRKHYFAPELNNRYFDRMREQIQESQEA
jgi:hypothetical protein